jgi:hypothetical protein
LNQQLLIATGIILDNRQSSEGTVATDKETRLFPPFKSLQNGADPAPRTAAKEPTRDI